MALFFIAATGQFGDGENLDLFAVAATPEDAVRMWQDHYGDSEIAPDKVFQVPPYSEYFDKGLPRPLAWGTDVKEVWAA